MIDKFAERGLRSLAVARQVFSVTIYREVYVSLFLYCDSYRFEWCRKFSRRRKMLLVAHGNL